MSKTVDRREPRRDAPLPACEPAAPAAPLPAIPAGTAHRWVRAGLLLVLLAAGGLTSYQMGLARAWEQRRAYDIEVSNLAGTQRMLSQRLGLQMAALGAPDPAGRHAATLARTLEQSQQQAGLLESRLAGFDAGDAATAQALHEALARWAAARNQLWLTAHALLDRLDQDGLASGAAGFAALQQRAVQQSDLVLQHAQALVERFIEAARLRHQRSVAHIEHWAALNLALLAALGIGLAEPMARLVRRQHRRIAEQAAQLEQLALVAEKTHNAVLIVDAAQRVRWVNAAFGALCGRSAAATRDLHLHAALRLVDDEATAALASALRHRQGARLQLQAVRSDGAPLWLDVDVQPLRGDEAVPGGFVLVAADVTAGRDALLAEQLAALAFESQDGIIVTDAEQRILKVNAAFSAITGYTGHEALGRRPGELLSSGRHGADFYAALWQALRRDGHWEGEIWNRRKGGELFPEWLRITAIKDPGGRATHYVAMFSDITRRKQDEARMQHLAFFDPLTELPNRRLLLDRLQQAMAAAERHGRAAALLFLDLDRFKQLNDTLGHDYGDLLLQEVAQRLRAQVRANDTVARLGGDEFVVLLDDLPPDPAAAAHDAALVAEKIRAAIAAPYALRGHVHHSSPSIGVCLFDGARPVADELLRRADAAMYAAKRAGRNAVRFHADTEPAPA